jgi:hypothetical protein
MFTKTNKKNDWNFISVFGEYTPRFESVCLENYILLQQPSTKLGNDTRLLHPIVVLKTFNDVQMLAKLSTLQTHLKYFESIHGDCCNHCTTDLSDPFRLWIQNTKSRN